MKTTSNGFLKKLTKALNIFTFISLLGTATFLYSQKDYNPSFWIMMIVSIWLLFNMVENILIKLENQ